MPHSLQVLTTLLCADLLANPGDSDISYCCIQVPLKTVSALFRCAYDGSYFNTVFTLNPEHCIGAIVAEIDGQYWREPEMSAWATLEDYQRLFGTVPEPDLSLFRSLEDYQGEFPDKPIPAAVPWPMLLQNFATVEIVRQHPEQDCLDVIRGSGRELAARKDLEALLLTLG